MDSTRLQAKLAALQRTHWIDGARRWWPNYLFHCTHLLNAVNIISDSVLLSRTQALSTSRMAKDIAAPTIIERTNVAWQDYVRLYFRPRTPTQFRNEGIRPDGDMPYGAQCSVPVYLLFDAASVLSRPDILFTDGNVASNPNAQSQIEEFERLPFHLIYHSSPILATDPTSITYHRNAEVLVPRQLPLDSLKWIACRSEAEYETLLHLLPTSVRVQWIPRIGVWPNYQLFHNRWSFVERVRSSGDILIFTLNKQTESPGPFAAVVELLETATGTRYRWSRTDYDISETGGETLRLNISRLTTPRDYTVSFTLDDHLAYANRIQDDDLPF